MVSIPHNAQTSSLEESDKLEATKELIEVEWRKMKETDDSVLSRQESLQSAFVVISNVITTTKSITYKHLYILIYSLSFTGELNWKCT